MSDINRRPVGDSKILTDEQKEALLAMSQPEPGTAAPTKDDLEAIKAEVSSVGVRPVAAVQPDTAPYAEPAPVRAAPKSMAPMPSAAVADMLAAQDAVAPADEMVTFISRMPSLTMYVEMPGKVMDRGQAVPRMQQIQFTNGFYRTDDPVKVAAIRAHPRCNSGLFREAPSNEAAALFRAATSAREKLRSNAMNGVTTALQGNDTTFMNNDAQLANVNERTYVL